MTQENDGDYWQHTVIIVFIIIGITVLWATSTIQNGKTERVKLELTFERPINNVK